MSENWIFLLPTEPTYVPAAAAQDRARALYAQFVPEAEEVNVEITEGIRFIDPGANLRAIYCSHCGKRVSRRWWNQAMGQACGVPAGKSWDDLDTWGVDHEPEFTELDTITPCCRVVISLNDLRYDWPAGFARFVLEALHPQVRDLTEQQITSLQEILHCRLRRVWAHY